MFLFGGGGWGSHYLTTEPTFVITNTTCFKLIRDQLRTKALQQYLSQYLFKYKSGTSVQCENYGGSYSSKEGLCAANPSHLLSHKMSLKRPPTSAALISSSFCFYIIAQYNRTEGTAEQLLSIKRRPNHRHYNFSSDWHHSKRFIL